MQVETTHLLLSFFILFFSLGFLDGSHPLLCANSSGLVALSSDGCEVGTDNTTLVLHDPT